MGRADDEQLTDVALDQAMAAVLEAERAARAAVLGSAQEAERIIGQARSAEKAIADRAARRCAQVRSAMAARLAARLAAIDEEVARVAAATGEAQWRNLDPAVARLADELTGSP